jgi:hypothetical protein
VKWPIIALFLALCAINGAMLPVFEAPDEIAHYQVAEYMQRERRLPDLNGATPSHEAAQPPLYYALAAAAISPFDHTNFETIRLLEPAWFDRELNPDLITVANQHQHTSPDEQWPWRGAVWAVRAARFLSSLLGALTVLGVFAIARAASGGDQIVASLAAALTAFNPKFVHVASIVSNDIAITCAATLTCALLCHMLTDANRTARARLWLGLGALIGVAALCKLGGLGLFAPAGLALLALGRAGFWRKGIALALGFALSAGPWLLHNTVAYGDPLAFARVRTANAALLRDAPLGVRDMLATLPDLLATYYGRIGIGFDLPIWARLLLAAGFLLAVLGCAARITRWLAGRPSLTTLPATPLGALLIWQVALIALFIPWLRSYEATENSRLLLPGAAAVATWVALGWLALASAQTRRAVATVGAAALLVISATTPWTTIRPAFATPTLRTATDGNTMAIFDGRIRLVGARLERSRLMPGDAARVLLTWGALQPLGDSYRVLLEAIDLDGRPVGRRMFIPFNGRYDTRRWQPGGVFEDAYALPLQPGATATVARIELSIFRQYPEPGLLPIDGREARALTVGRVKIGPRPAADDARAYATFGERIKLSHWSFDASQTVFVWDVTQAPGADYTLFVKAFDAAGNPLLAEDAQPFNAQYPTGLWERGERVRDARAFAIPSDATRIQLGWYDATGARLAATDADGKRWRDDVVEIVR